MINEWDEFLQYTGPVTYSASGKRDAGFLGRFTWDTLLDFEGLARIFTILARGYLFHHPDGSLADEPRSRVEYARRALCTWCSVPDEQGAARKIKKGFDDAWRNKVRQFQVPLFSPSTKGQWIIRFDTALADGLELGPLRMADMTVPPELAERIRAILPKGLPPQMVCTLIAYYAANRPKDSDWVVLPVASFDAYFGTTSFSRKYLRLIPSKILERSDSGFGICRYRVREEYRI